jgi:hypothetical protein
METALGLVADKDGDDVLDFMGYAIGRSVCGCSRPVLGPLVKGWLYTLNPEFMKTGYNDAVGWEVWLDAQKKKLGDNVSITPMPANEMAAAAALLDTLAQAKQTAEDKTAEAEAALAAKAAADADVAAMMPFKKKAEDLEKKLAKSEEQNSALAAQVAELKEKLASFDGKVAIDEKEIEKSVKDIVSKAVAGLAAAGGVAVAAADGAAPFEAAAEEPASDGGVPDTFGFGTSGADGDGFGF